MKIFAATAFALLGLIVAAPAWAQMHQDAAGRWLNSAGGNLYGDSTLNPAANPQINPDANPAYNAAANPAYNAGANPAYNAGANPSLNPFGDPSRPPFGDPAYGRAPGDYIYNNPPTPQHTWHPHDLDLEELSTPRDNSAQSFYDHPFAPHIAPYYDQDDQ